MNTKFDKIANIKLIISEKCPKEHIEILETYWALYNSEFINTAKQVKQQFNIDQSELTSLNRNFAEFSFYIFCKECYSYENHTVVSQSAFKIIVNKYTSTNQKNCCHNCEAIQKQQKEKEQQEAYKNLLHTLNDAIKNKNWLTLSKFDKEVLLKCLEVNFDELKQYYGKILGQFNFIKFIRALERLESVNLLVLYRNTNYNNYIYQYKYLDALKKLKNEISIKHENSPNYNNTNDVIKLKLTVNEFQNHPDSPKYAGIVKFPEKIVIQPNVDYIFGHWQRANNNLYLTLAPLENLEKLPQQKLLSRAPLDLQKGITEFINNLGRNLDFK